MTRRRPSHRWLLELTDVPSTSGREWRVVNWVARWARRRSDLAFTFDEAGNLLISMDPRTDRAPIAIVAHMDHPGFVVTETDGRSLSARFMGGVLPEYFGGAAVEFFDGDDNRSTGTVARYEPQVQEATVVLDSVAGSLVEGDIGRWRFRSSSIGISSGRLRAHACDDLAGVAAALSVLDRARGRPELSHLMVLLTRAEEEGFVGAIAACRSGTVPRNARVFSMEASRCSAAAPMGGGPIVRVGDGMSVFDRALTDNVSSIARNSGVMHQRRLMDGGACEASAFGAYGFQSTGLCLPLSNFHNMSDLDAVNRHKPSLVPEEIALDDYDGLIRLMLSVVQHLDDRVSPLRESFDRRLHECRDLLQPHGGNHSPD